MHPFTKLGLSLMFIEFPLSAGGVGRATYLNQKDLDKNLARRSLRGNGGEKKEIVFEVVKLCVGNCILLRTLCTVST